MKFATFIVDEIYYRSPRNIYRNLLLVVSFGFIDFESIDQERPKGPQKLEDNEFETFWTKTQLKITRNSDH